MSSDYLEKYLEIVYHPLSKYTGFNDRFKQVSDISVKTKGAYQVVTPYPAVTDYINKIREECSMSEVALKKYLTKIKDDVPVSEPENIFSSASPNAPTVTNSNGASESGTNLRFDLIPPNELATIAKILNEGAIKYGEFNWKGINTLSHLNHALQHIFAYISGDRSDDHLGHAATRMLFAMWTAKNND